MKAMEYAPIVRIVLRYLVGAGMMGSVAAGDKLAADPDLVFFGCAAIGGLVELIYAHAKRTGGKT